MGLPRVAVPEYSLKLPSSGEEIKYRPFLVKEEKLLLIATESEDENEIIVATKNVIKNCVFSELDIDKLPIFDIEYIFLWLRARSKGEMIDLKYSCPKCKGEIPVQVNVEDVKVETVDGHSNKIELTDDLGICLKYPNMSFQSEIEALKDKDQITLMFQSVLMCIDYIYDQKEMYSAKDYTTDELNDFLESLNDKQFEKITMFFETAPKLKHNVKLECLRRIKDEDKKDKKKDKKVEVCGYTEDVVLEGLQSFFD
jgi:hypothetical protein